MKKRCYPTYSYVLFLILSVTMVVLAFIPFIFFDEDIVLLKILWFFMCLIFSIMLLISSFVYMQTYLIDDESITVKCIGRVVNKLKLDDCVYEVRFLPTYFSWATTASKKWVCLYNKNESINRFKVGCCNRKKESRIQIIYSKEVIDFLKRRNITSL